MLELTLTLVKFCQISIVAVMVTVEIDLFLRNPIQLKPISYSLITHALGYNTQDLFVDRVVFKI